MVLLSTRGLDRKSRDTIAAFVRNGGGLLVAASTDVEPAVLATMMGWQGFSAAVETEPAGALAPTDLRHPIFRPFGALAVNLGDGRFDRTWTLRAEGWDVLARFTNGSPALMERREGRGRVVLFASDLSRRWNDFPLQPGVRALHHRDRSSCGRIQRSAARLCRGRGAGRACPLNRAAMTSPGDGSLSTSIRGRAPWRS